MKKSIVTAIAATAMFTIMFCGISSAGPKGSFAKSYKPSTITKGISTKFKRPTRLRDVRKPLQPTVASLLAACNNKYPGMGVNHVEFHQGKGYLCIVGDIPVGWL
jgi:hypothetical protein